MGWNEARNKIMNLYVLCVLILSGGSLLSRAQSNKLNLVYKKAESMVSRFVIQNIVKLSSLNYVFFSLKIQLEELKQSYKEITEERGSHESKFELFWLLIFYKYKTNYIFS